MAGLDPAITGEGDREAVEGALSSPIRESRNV